MDLARALRRTTARGVRARVPAEDPETPPLPSGAVFDLWITEENSYQTRTANTTPAGVGDPLRRVVAATGEVFAVATDDDAGTLRADGAELQVYDESTRPNPELVTSTPVTLSGPFTAFFVATLTTRELWATDVLLQGRKRNAQYSEPSEEDPAYPSDLLYAVAAGATAGTNEPGGFPWYVPPGRVFFCLRRDENDDWFLSGTNAVYDPWSERKERLLGNYALDVELTMIGKAYRSLADDWYSSVNTSTSNRYERFLFYDTSLSVSDYNDVLANFEADHGISTDRREPITPTVPSYTLPGTVPSEFSRPLFRPDQLVFTGGVRLPNLTVAGQVLWIHGGGMTGERDGGTLKFTLSHHLENVVRLTTAGATWSTDADVTTWDTLSSSFDELSPFNVNANLGDVSGVLRHPNGDTYVTAFNSYGSPETQFVARRTLAGTDYGGFVVSGFSSQAAAGLTLAPAWFADYCADEVGTDHTILMGTGGYKSGGESGGSHAAALLDSTHAGAYGSTIASVALASPCVFNEPDETLKERRDPDFEPTIAEPWEHPIPPGENAYWGSVDVKGGVTFVDSDNGHGVIFIAGLGIGLQEYNFQSVGFCAANRQALYVVDPGQYAAVARGVLDADEPRAKWYEVEYPCDVPTGLPRLAGHWFEAGTGTGGLDVLYLLYTGVVDHPTVPQSAILRFDVGPQS